MIRIGFALLMILALNCSLIKQEEDNNSINNLLLLGLISGFSNSPGIFLRQRTNNSFAGNSNSRINQSFEEPLNIVGIPISQYGDGFSDGKYDRFETPIRTALRINNIHFYKSPEKGGVANGQENAFNSDAKLNEFDKDLLRIYSGMWYEAENFSDDEYLESWSKEFLSKYSNEEYDRIAISIHSIHYTFSDSSNLNNIKDIEFSVGTGDSLSLNESGNDPEPSKENYLFYDIPDIQYNQNMDAYGKPYVYKFPNESNQPIEVTYGSIVRSTPFFHCPLGKNFDFDCYNTFNSGSQRNLIQFLPILTQTGSPARSEFQSSSDSFYFNVGSLNYTSVSSWKKPGFPDYANHGLMPELGADPFKSFNKHFYMFKVFSLGVKKNQNSKIVIEIDPTNVFVWESDTDNNRPFQQVPVPQYIEEERGIIKLHPDFSNNEEWKDKSDNWRANNPIDNENSPDPINDKGIKVHLPVMKAYYE